MSEATTPADVWKARALLWKQAAKRHRKLHQGYRDAAEHFARESNNMAALAGHNADLYDALLAAEPRP